MMDCLTIREMTSSNPKNDRSLRKKALSEARKKLALRKMQREELRAQRAARMNGKIEASSLSSTLSPSPMSNVGKPAVAKIASFSDFMDDDDSKDDFSIPVRINKASLNRKPWRCWLHIHSVRARMLCRGDTTLIVM